MDLKKGIITLDEFIIKRQEDFAYATGDLSRLLRDLGFAAKIIHREINRAGLVDILGEHGTENIQGEVVQKLDILADNILIDSLKSCGGCAAIASEEQDNILVFPGKEAEDAEYVMAFDPLDGSSNIDVNVSVGTIFSIYKRKTADGPATDEDFLQKGMNQVAAGYIIYGSSTMLVYTTGRGVNGFTLDPSIGEFCLSHPNIQTPKDGKIYSLNQGNFHSFPEGVKEYIQSAQSTENGKKAFSLRYIGSMVADFHRNLLKGGIFIYPSSASAPNGKLRLLYECNPLAFIVEQAGGKATDGNKRIMDLDSTELHQRTPIFIGSENMVDQAVEMYQKHKAINA